MSSSIIGVIAVTIIGLLCALMLVIAAKFMAVPVDERIPKVRECLPGANCGACGFAGCNGYAEALVGDEDLPVNLCIPGGAGTAAAIGEVLGRAAGESVKMVAVVNCKGDCNKTSNKMDYKGIQTCTAASNLFAGPASCAFGCVGLGECAAACPQDAICIVDGLARVDERLCIGCGICAKTCPKHIITIQPADDKIRVLCSNKDKGASVKKICSVGCLGCGLCAKNCPKEAIEMVDNKPVIDFSKCVQCGLCAKKCPANTIVDLKHPAKKAAPAAAPAAEAPAPAAEAPAPEA